MMYFHYNILYASDNGYDCVCKGHGSYSKAQTITEHIRKATIYICNAKYTETQRMRMRKHTL